MNSRQTHRKGDAPLADSLAMVAAVALSILVVFLFITKSLVTLAAELAVESAEIVAKDTAGFITISAAAPEKIEITYKPSSKFSYNLDIASRTITVQQLLEGKFTEGPDLFGYKLEPISTKEVTAIDVGQVKITDARLFEITKDISAGKYVYKIEGGKSE